jgi:glucokinase
MKKGDPSAVVAKMGLSGECKICAEALEVFASLYGSEAGDLALKIMATGGVFIGGGIAPKIIEKLSGPHFMEGFLNKGRMKDLLKDIPVKVVLNDQTALLGAAQYAKLMMKQ